MPARRNPKKSRRTPLGTNPTTEHGRPRATRPDLDLAVEPAVQTELTTSIEVPAAVDAPAVGDLPKSAARPAAPTAGPPQGGGGRSGGGRSQQAGQTRRYAFRRS
jgi:hypothetical protein